MGGEFRAIERIRALLPSPPPGETWIGDDAAVVSLPGGGSLLLATDALVAGVHFDAELADLEDVGWKAVAVNVSDIAAMGGRPLQLLVAVAGPPKTDLDALFRGIADAAKDWTCPVVGGDLVNAPTLVVTVSMTGTTDGRPPILRSGARAGDAVLATGQLGGMAASGYAWRPFGRVLAGQTAAGAGATAMIDVSDGLAADLAHLADASGVGVVLEHVPVAPGATEAQALGGGEDYELLFAIADPERAAAAFAAAGLDPPIRVATCTDDVSQRPPSAGWEHDFLVR